MASSLSHRFLAAALDRAQKEKEERLHKEWVAQREALEREAEEKEQDLIAVAQKRKELEERRKKGEDELEELQSALRAERGFTVEEDTIQAVQRRMQDFHGSDDTSLRARLLAEGFSEMLAQQLVRLRTTDQSAPWDVGLHAAFDRFPGALEEALGRDAPSGRPWSPKDENEPQTLYRQENPERERLYNAGLPEAVTDAYNREQQYGRADGQEAKRSDIEEGVRKGLGLDAGTSTLQYGRQ